MVSDDGSCDAKESFVFRAALTPTHTALTSAWRLCNIPGIKSVGDTVGCLRPLDDAASQAYVDHQH